MKVLIYAGTIMLLLMVLAPNLCAQCPGPAFCDSVMRDPCLVICPASDIVYKVILKDSCGNPVCDLNGTRLEFSTCPAIPCPGEEPNWPFVRPDSCDQATGTHYFTVDASLQTCTTCDVDLWVNNQPCGLINARFLDIDADFCVTAADWVGAICNDYDCDNVVTAADQAFWQAHLDHCCQSDCDPGPPFCDSVTNDPCLLVCPASDVVYKVTVKDSCGNPLCDTLGTYLDFSQCPVIPCPNEEPNWPLVFPDSCDVNTGIHYFTVDAGLIDCTVCDARLMVNGAFCRQISTRYFDTNGDLCVTPADWVNSICNDYDCDFVVSAVDQVIWQAHIDHCCVQGPCLPGPPFCDSVTNDPCLLVCPASDVVFKVFVKDSCGNPLCDTLGTYLDFSQCPAIPCPNEEPNWPLVFSDSCDPGTGTHYFTVDAGLIDCTICDARLIVNGAFCRSVPTRFFDTNGDLCVTSIDWVNGICNDYDCDFNVTAVDQAIWQAHVGHCCEMGPCDPGPPFCDSVMTDPCLLVCPESDVVYRVTVKDSCGNPICDPNTWLDFGQCLALPCPNEEPAWPRVFPDSCDPANGIHYFTVDAGLRICDVCPVLLFVNGAVCRTILAQFFDVNGDLQVTLSDSIPSPICNDYNCNGAIDAGDFFLWNTHFGHECCCLNRGNADHIIGVGGPIDVADLSYLVAYLFQNGPPPPCIEEGNIDGLTGVGGPIDVADLTYLVAFLFGGGPPPPPC